MPDEFDGDLLYDLEDFTPAKSVSDVLCRSLHERSPLFGFLRALEVILTLQLGHECIVDSALPLGWHVQGYWGCDTPLLGRVSGHIDAWDG